MFLLKLPLIHNKGKTTDITKNESTVCLIKYSNYHTEKYQQYDFIMSEGLCIKMLK